MFWIIIGRNEGRTLSTVGAELEAGPSETESVLLSPMSVSSILADLTTIIASVSGWFYENFKLQ